MVVVRATKAALTRGRALAWGLTSHPSAEGLRILLYHRVSTDADPLALSPHRFRRQMEHLAAEGFRAIDAVSALDMLHSGQIDPTLVAITFDDGFKDIENSALEVLAELGFSASVFVATSMIAGKARYPWLKTDVAMLDWDDVRRLDAAGVLRFEPHSVTHPRLTRLSDEDCRREIIGSKVALEEQIERETSTFCYPGGFFGARERRLVAEAGFRYGITCEPGLNTAATDPYAIRRIQVDGTDSLRDFAAKMEGSHDRPLPGRGPYRRIRYGE